MIELSEQAGDVLLTIKVVPNASRDALVGELDSALKVTTAAAPERGAANKAVCKLIARKFGLRRQQVSIESGQTSPHKIVRITDTNVEEIRKLLTST